MCLSEADYKIIQDKITNIENDVKGLVADRALMLKAFLTIQNIARQPGRYGNESAAVLLVSTLILDRFGDAS